MAVVINGNGNITGLDGVFSADSVNTLVDNRDTHDSAAVQAQLDSAFAGIDDNATDTILTLSGSSTTNNSLVTELAQTSTSGYYIGSNSHGLEAYEAVNSLSTTLRLKGSGNTILSHNSAEDGIRLRTNDTDRLFIKSTGEVGIGTLGPSSILHVYNDVDSDEQIIIAETFGDYSRGTGISFVLDQTEMGRVNAHETRGMTFYACPGLGQDGLGAAAVERMRIDISGNVGIGTTSPSARLTVDDSDYLKFVIRDTAGGDVPLSVGSGSNAITISNDSSGTGSREYVKLNRTNQTVNFGTSGTERMRIDSSGNVGIGTTSPSSHLHVYNGADSEEQILIAEVSGGYSNGAGVSLRRAGTEMGRVNADYFDGMTFHVTDGAGGAATQKARLSTGGSFVIGENETPYNAFSVRDSDMGFEVNPNASKEVRLNAYDRGNSVFKTMALQADPVVIRPGGANGVGYTTIDNDGIKFNGDTAAANGLDDYEEGSFTPQMNHTSGTPTYTYQEGRYTKIGDVVHAHGIIGVSNSTSLGGAIGVTNLPFAIARAGSYGYTMGSVSDGSGFTFPVGNGFYTLYLQTSGNSAIFVGIGTSAGVVNHGATGIAAGLYFRFNLTYYG